MQRVSPPSFGQRLFGTAQGLVDPSVISLQVLRDGRVLSGTQNGLAFRFGEGFITPEVPHRSKQIEALCELPSGRIAVGTAGAGVFILDAHGQVINSIKPILADSIVDTLACSPSEEVIWLGNSDGLHRVTATAADLQSQMIVNVRTTAIATGVNRIIAASGRQINAIDAAPGAKPTLLATVEEGDVVEALLDLKDGVWVGSELGLQRLGSASRLEPLLGTKDLQQVYALVRGENDEVFAGSFSGVIMRCQKGTCSREADADGTVLSMAMQGGEKPLLWVGTDHGLLRINLTGFRSFPDVPFLSQRTEDLTVDNESQVYVGGQGGFGTLNGGEFKVFAAEGVGGPEANAVLSLAYGDQPMFGTRMGGLFRIKQNEVQEIPLKLSPYQSIFGLHASGSHWLASTRAGLFVGQGSLVFPPSLTTPTGAAYAAAWWPEEQSSNIASNTPLWLATETALYVRDSAEVWKKVGAEDGLLNDNVNVLTPERSGASVSAMWVGTNGGGAIRFAPKGTKWSTIGLDERVLRNGVVNSIVQDPRGRIYIGTNMGVTRVTLSCAPAEECLVKNTEYFSVEDGLPDSETIIGAAAVDGEGRYYVGTAKGLALLAGRDDRNDTQTKSLLLRQPRVDEVEVELARLTQLDHHHQSVRFDWALVSNFRDEETRYRTQLLPIENTPRDWNRAQSREFTGLNAGQYRLLVWGRDYAGNVTGPSSVPMVIAPPPWATWWAYTLYASVLLGIAFLGARVRIRQLQNRAAHLERIVEERTRDVVQKAEEIQKKNEELEASYKEADLIFQALREALKGSLLNDRYRLEDEIGVGGFGVVYRAQEVRTGETFAVKVFRPQSGNDSTDSLERFKQEGKTSARILHPNAIRVFEHGVTKDGIAYIVMEMLSGRSVQAELDEAKRLPYVRVLQICAPACEALAFAHQLGVIHRDIKPDNIFLHHDADGKEIVKVLDFGVAKANRNSMTMAMHSLTMSGELVGTPYYLAPERIQSQQYDGRSDVYAVGVMMFQMLTGEVPFGAKEDNMFSAVLAHLNHPVPDLPVELMKDMPEAVSVVVRQAMEKDPDERLAAAEFAARLRELLTG